MYNIKQKSPSKSCDILEYNPQGTQYIRKTTLILKVRNCEHKSQERIKKSLVDHFNEMKLPVTFLEFIGIDYVPKAPRKKEAGAAY